MDQKEFAAQYNRLTSLFLRKFAEKTGNDNMVFSPFSILSLLSILADATGGTTGREVKDLLHGEPGHRGFSERLKEIREILRRKEDCSEWLDYDDPSLGKPYLDRDEHLHTSNAVVVKEEYRDTIRPDFQKHFRDVYDGILVSAPEDLRKALKDPALKDMEEALPLLEEMLDSSAVLAMINTVSFQAMWQYPYEEYEIKEGVFHNADGTDSTVTMLHGGGSGFVENRQATGFVRDFQQCDYSFVALLPRRKGPDALRKTLEKVDFCDLMENRRNVILHTKMPEFKTSFRVEMKEIMESLGVREAFTPKADFSPLSTAPLMADRMIHQAEIEVDRNGARATAATALVCIGAGLPQETKRVMIDRPFLFAIVNNKLNTPVFIGVMNHMDRG